LGCLKSELSSGQALKPTGRASPLTHEEWYRRRQTSPGPCPTSCARPDSPPSLSQRSMSPLHYYPALREREQWVWTPTCPEPASPTHVGAGLRSRRVVARAQPTRTRRRRAVVAKALPARRRRPRSRPGLLSAARRALLFRPAGPFPLLFRSPSCHERQPWVIRTREPFR